MDERIYQTQREDKFSLSKNNRLGGCGDRAAFAGKGNRFRQLFFFFGKLFTLLLHNKSNWGENSHTDEEGKWYRKVIWKYFHNN